MTHRMNPHDQDGRRWVTSYGKLLRVWLNPSHGAQLLSLPYDLVWATSWEHDANELIAPELSMPELPVVTFARPIKKTTDRTHWKLRELIAYASGRDFAWLDDESTVTDGVHAMTRHSGQFLMIPVQPHVGLTEGHLTQLREWAEELSGERD